MMNRRLLKAVSLTCVCAGLAACNAAGTGNPSNAMAMIATSGTPPTNTGKTAFDQAFETAQRQLATQTPLAGTASYSGQVSVRTNANAADANEAVYGDLAMSVNFDPNQNRPIDATVSNLSGNIDGQATDITGSLSTANAPNQINAVTATNLNIPGVGPVTSTGISVGLEGALSDPTGTLTGDALMTLQGTMVGTNGASVFGANSVVIKPSSGANVITGGQFYANMN